MKDSTTNKTERVRRPVRSLEEICAELNLPKPTLVEDHTTFTTIVRKSRTSDL